MPREYALPSQQPAQAPAPGGYKYEQQYHGGAPVNAAATVAAAAAAANSASPPVSSSHLRDGNGDISMRDSHDGHAGINYQLRPHHQSHPSGGRSAGLQSPQDPSIAVQRYSPMDTLSPSSPYGSKLPQYANPPPQRQSPAKQGDYSQSPYFAGRPQQGQQLPPITSYTQDGYPSAAVANLDGPFGADPRSPAHQQMPPLPKPRGPVPEFRKVRGVGDLRPKNSRQPPFRRANPEGGFISVSGFVLPNNSLI